MFTAKTKPRSKKPLACLPVRYSTTRSLLSAPTFQAANGRKECKRARMEGNAMGRKRTNEDERRGKRGGGWKREGLRTERHGVDAAKLNLALFLERSILSPRRDQNVARYGEKSAVCCQQLHTSPLSCPSPEPATSTPEEPCVC